MTTPTDIDAIKRHASVIIDSGVLGRSRFYKALLEYLVARAEAGHVPKEVEIAAEVFRRGDEFDPSQDSMVRVYVHNLRQKLHQYYQSAEPLDGDARRLAIPKGEYRVVLADQDPDTGRVLVEAHKRARLDPMRVLRSAALVLVGLLGGLLMARLTGGQGPQIENFEAVASSLYWSDILDDDRPVVVVSGDYYIFAERGPDGAVARLVREFAVNSRQDLDELMLADTDAARRYLDLDLTYLPSSTGAALREVLRVLYSSGKAVDVTTMSALSAMDIRDSHVIYVGYLSGLDKLIDFVFMGSELAIGDTYDELVDTVTGARFLSEAGLPSSQIRYRDYGLVSSFPGGNDNRFLILAGTRDEGLMHSAFAVSDPDYVAASTRAVRQELGGSAEAFEILYEVAGFDRTNMDAAIVHVAQMRDGAVWSTEEIQAD